MTTWWHWFIQQPASVTSFLATLLGIPIGFATLAFGALYNARQNRLRDDRLRDQERRSVAAAIRAELVVVQQIFDINTSRLRSDPPYPGDSFVNPDPAQSVRVFASLTPKLILLDQDVVTKILEAYVVCEQYIDRVLLMGGKPMDGLPPHRRAVIMPAGTSEAVAHLNTETSAYLATAIAAIDRTLGAKTGSRP